MLTRSIFISINDLKPHTPEKGVELLTLLDYCLRLNIDKNLTAEALVDLPVLVNYRPFIAGHHFPEEFVESKVVGGFEDSVERSWHALSSILEKTVHQLLMEFYIWSNHGGSSKVGYTFINFTGAVVNGNTYVLSAEFMG